MCWHVNHALAIWLKLHPIFKLACLDEFTSVKATKPDKYHTICAIILERDMT